MSPWIEPVQVSPERFPWLRFGDFSFSLAVTDGTTYWLSGQAASEYDPDTGHVTVRGGLAQQAELAYKKVGAVLAAAGLRWSDVIAVQELVPHWAVAGYGEIAKRRHEVFTTHRPTVTTTIVDGLLREQAGVEIHVTAAEGGGTPLVDIFRPGRSPARVAGGNLYLPTLLPVDPDGKVVFPDEPVRQLRYLLDSLTAELSRVGLAETSVRLELFLAAAGLDRAAVRPMCADTGLSASVIFVSGLHRPGISIAISGHVEGDGDAQRVRLAPSGHDDGADPVVSQARSIYEPWDAGNASPTHQLVETVEYVARRALSAYRRVGTVRKEMLSLPYPASTGCICSSFEDPRIVLEVEAVAVPNSGPAKTARPMSGGPAT